MYHIDLEQFAKNTPLEGFITSDKLLKGKNMLSHMSDCLRMLIVYKYGGLYLGKILIQALNRRKHSHFQTLILL